MGGIDDLPQRHWSHELAQAAESAFEAAIDESRFFVQSKDRSDYGTDLQLEVKDGASATNVRIHVQLKGSSTTADGESRVRVSIRRTNLNYLLVQSNAIYVCFHATTQRLLVKFAENVFRSYEHEKAGWRDLEWLTVVFEDPFDDVFQKVLHERSLVTARSRRDERLGWLSASPNGIAALVRESIPAIEVPADVSDALVILKNLYEAGQDAVISRSFDQFKLVLRDCEEGLLLAYLAEINLGLNRARFDEHRVRDSLSLLSRQERETPARAAAVLYALGNAHLALRELEEARDAYHLALMFLDEQRNPELEAQCAKNLGTVFEELGSADTALAFYERAIDLNPDLGEAHVALGHYHRKDGGDLETALHHFRAVSRRRGSPIEMAAVQGWTIEVLFRIGRVEEAYGEISRLINEADRTAWVWPWCAKLVSIFSRSSLAAARPAVGFWSKYVREHADDLNARRERVLLLMRLRFVGEETNVTFDAFRNEALILIDAGDPDSALLWDRVGHWAQCDEDWAAAARAYEQAFHIDPSSFGYCYGTALNFLKRYDEALPILTEQAEQHSPTAMSWFQVAVAREGTGDNPGAIEAYDRAIELDADYAVAWFNKGGIHWNMKDIEKARQVWREAIVRFPEHECADKLEAGDWLD